MIRNKGVLYADAKENQQVKELTSLLSMRHAVADQTVGVLKLL
jgi:hypothetical protein